MKKFALIALISTFATGAFAHSPLRMTEPLDGAALSDVPAQIVFGFINEIRLTRVEMTHQDHPTVRLDLGEQNSFDHDFTLPVQEMGDGTYRIEWRGLGADGHAMQGAFTFTVE